MYVFELLDVGMYSRSHISGLGPHIAAI
eukprot:COSAG03_NODE_22622_length_288_cov_2.179894_1_plen_27_part_10